MSFLRKLSRDRRGAVLVEYGLVVAGVALVAVAAISVFGHKTNDLIATSAAILPGAHADDNGPIVSGKIVETTGAADGPISVDLAGIGDATDTSRLATNYGFSEEDLEALVVEVGEEEEMP